MANVVVWAVRTSKDITHSPNQFTIGSTSQLVSDI